MKEICRFTERPATIVDGGRIKGHDVVWVNLCVEPMEPEEGSSDAYRSVSARLVLTSRSAEALVEAADAGFLALATDDEAEAILAFFGEADDVEAWRTLRRAQIEGYDRSDAVNSFTLHGQRMWLDKATRVGLVNSLSAERDAGLTTSTLWADGQPIELPIDDALAMLRTLELYALACYRATATLLATVAAAPTASSLRHLPLHTPYPPQLTFEE